MAIQHRIPGIRATACGEEMGDDLGPSTTRCLLEDFGIENEVRCALGERFETGDLHGLHIGNLSFHFRRLATEGGEVFAGELGFRGCAGELSKQALIKLDRIVVAVLFPPDFGEPEERGGGFSPPPANESAGPPRALPA
jgi:hypothetical protein